MKKIFEIEWRSSTYILDAQKIEIALSPLYITKVTELSQDKYTTEGYQPPCQRGL